MSTKPQRPAYNRLLWVIAAVFIAIPVATGIAADWWRQIVIAGYPRFDLPNKLSLNLIDIPADVGALDGKKGWFEGLPYKLAQQPDGGQMALVCRTVRQKFDDVPTLSATVLVRIPTGGHLIPSWAQLQNLNPSAVRFYGTLHTRMSRVSFSREPEDFTRDDVSAFDLDADGFDCGSLCSFGEPQWLVWASHQIAVFKGAGERVVDRGGAHRPRA